MNLAIYAPAPISVVRKMLEMAQVTPDDVICDLGSGDGRLLFTAVKEFGAKKAIGHEIKGDLCKACRQDIERQNLQSRIVVTDVDMLDANLSEVSVIMLYLSEAANEMLRPKLEREAKSGTRIVNYLIPMKGWQPVDKLVLGVYPWGEDHITEAIYLFTIPESFEKT